MNHAVGGIRSTNQTRQDSSIAPQAMLFIVKTSIPSLANSKSRHRARRVDKCNLSEIELQAVFQAGNRTTFAQYIELAGSMLIQLVSGADGFQHWFGPKTRFIQDNLNCGPLERRRAAEQSLLP